MYTLFQRVYATQRSLRLKGAVIAVDEKEIPVKCIDDAFCCPEFSKIIKIVIIQACQGKAIGESINNIFDGI